MAAAVIVALAVALTGCSRTITVTGKFQDILGWYFLCNGTGSFFGDPLPACRQGHEWRVSQQTYDGTTIGATVTLNY